jgi:dihydrofolate reductase
MKEWVMSKVVLGMSTSLDGIAGGSSEAEFWSVHEAVLGWVFDLRSWRQAQGMDGGEDTVDSRVWAENFERIGAQIVGRTMFDYGYEPWGENPPFHAPVFVHTHGAGERIEKLGGTSYTFVTDGIGAAVEQAKAAAGAKDVLIAGGIQVARVALAAGVVDELQLHIAPVLLNYGVRLFDALGVDPIRLRNTAAVNGEGAVHLTYAVVR